MTDNVLAASHSLPMEYSSPSTMIVAVIGVVILWGELLRGFSLSFDS